MEEKFIAAFEHNRAAAALMGIRMRSLDVKAALAATNDPIILEG